MHKHLALLAVFTLIHGSGIAAGLEGTWFSCLPEMNSANILSIKRDGSKYLWKFWWGQYESGEGYVEFADKEAILFGCRSYRGEIEKGCDEQNPPEATRLMVAELKRKHRSYESALKGGAWIRTTDVGLRALDRDCEAVRERP